MTVGGVNAKSDSRIPQIDLRRIALYGPCHRLSPLRRAKPCTATSYRDDIHVSVCPQAKHSHRRVSIGSEWR